MGHTFWTVWHFNGTKSSLKICCKGGPVLFSKIDSALSTHFWFFLCSTNSSKWKSLSISVTKEQKCTISQLLPIENLQRGLFKKQTPCTFRGKAWMNNCSLKNALNWGSLHFLGPLKKWIPPQKKLMHWDHSAIRCPRHNQDCYLWVTSLHRYSSWLDSVPCT